MKNMVSKNETNEGFTCKKCGKKVIFAEKTARNHCPHCLWSLHVDDEVPGDRASNCNSLMEPVAIYQKHGEWVVIHRCLKCDKEQPNKCAVDDNFETIIDIGKQLAGNSQQQAV